MVTLILEAALVANFVPSNNSAALQAAVAMLFIFEIPYDWCLDGKLCTRFLGRGKLLIICRIAVHLHLRNLANPSASKRDVHGRRDDLADEHHVAAGCTNRF